MKSPNSNVTTFIDLFLMAFIATMILNVVSPKEDYQERFMFKFTTPKIGEETLKYIGFLKIGGDSFSSEGGDNEVVTWDLTEGQISATFTANPGTSKSLDILILDDFGMLGEREPNFNFTSSTVIDNGTLTQKDFYCYSTSLNR